MRVSIRLAIIHAPSTALSLCSISSLHVPRTIYFGQVYTHTETRPAAVYVVKSTAIIARERESAVEWITHNTEIQREEDSGRTRPPVLPNSRAFIGYRFVYYTHIWWHSLQVISQKLFCCRTCSVRARRATQTKKNRPKKRSNRLMNDSVFYSRKGRCIALFCLVVFLLLFVFFCAHFSLSLSLASCLFKNSTHFTLINLINYMY